MTDQVEPAIADTDGPAALPRRNGELVFDAPWESRAFAIAVGLTGEMYDWEEFRTELIKRIGEWEAAHDSAQEGWSYYDRWLLTLETMLLERGAISRGELAQRMELIADAEAHEHDDAHSHGDSRSHGHSHEHDHAHEHER